MNAELIHSRSAGSTGIRDISGTCTSAPGLNRTQLVVMAAACGLGIANLYYCQPLLGQIQRSLHTTMAAAGSLAVYTQIGFAVSVFFLAPLGDILERRRLILIMLALVTVSLAVAAFASNITVLGLASMAIGFTSVISTLVLPFAVSLAGEQQRGETVGAIVGAMLVGILLSRTLSGAVGELFGWRCVYGTAAMLMVVLAACLRFMLPKNQPPASMGYGSLIRSMIGFIKTEPVLRESTLNGMLLYGALSAFWATLVFLVASPAYRYGPAAAGMFGLVAAGGAIIAPRVGKLADRISPHVTVAVATGAMVFAYLLLWLFGTHLLGLIAGVLLLDMAAQSATISNQTMVTGLNAHAQSRLYTVYRAAYSAGGSIGAYLGVMGWSLAGWTGVCAVGTGMVVVALLLHIAARRNEARRAVAIELEGSLAAVEL